MNNRGSLIIFFSILAGFILRALPLPIPVNQLNPDWVLLILIYWSLATPERFGIGKAWITGLFADVLTGQLLGQHALFYALISYGCLQFHQRIRQFPFPQQMVILLLALLFGKLLSFWILTSQDITPESIYFWLVAFIETLAWPVLFVLLRQIRRSYRIQ